MAEIVALRQMRVRSLSLAEHFHQHRSRENSAGMDQCGFRNRPREVRDQTDVVRLAEGEDLHVLGDASYVRQSDTCVVNELLFDQRVDVPPGSELLADRNGYFDVRAEFLIDLGIFRSDQILGKVGLERLNQCAEPHGIREVEAGVVIQRPIAVFSHAVAYLDAVLVCLPHHLM